jgi:glycosyltransferase involved in cell wall biosynthesis
MTLTQAQEVPADTEWRSEKIETHRLGDITVIVVNYKTQDLTRRCVESLLNHYPDVNLLLIDNGSQDDSMAYIKQASRQLPNVQCILNRENRYHGPAMDQGIKFSTTRYIFTLDSDCEIIKDGFLECMVALFACPEVYAIGQLAYMDRYGYEVEQGRGRHLIQYIYPYAMLLDKEKYLKLSPFIHHGSPCIKNMKEAEERGYFVKNFPIEKFVFHQEKGTCSRYGYGLSPETLVDKLLSKLGLFV